MKTFQCIITLTVKDLDGPLSTEQIDVKAADEQGWISVTDRLPIKGGEYLVTDGASQMVARFDSSGVWDFYDNNTWWYSDDVTHWMPLIKSPLQ
jgi:hypothetical protein